MTQKTSYHLQVLEKIGAPLLSAAVSRPVEGRPNATIVAELLAVSVQSGVDLAAVMDVREGGAEGESVRLALAALSSELVGGLYRKTGSVPTPNETKSMAAALSAVLTFADNFTPAAGNTARLQALETGATPADETQVMIQCLSALTPVVAVVADYSFGRAEKKMVQDVTDRLVAQAGGIAGRLLPGAVPAVLKQAELTLLQALVPLYCACHEGEKKRILSMDDAARQAAQGNGGMLPLDSLWQAFDRQAAMLEILGQPLAARFGSGQASGGPVRPAPVSPVVVPMTPPPAAALPPEPQSAPPMADGPYNPMSFFKTPPKKAEGENT